MRSPVESVPAHVVALVKRIGKRVVERVGRHSLVEGGVKDRDLRHLGEMFPGHFNTRQIGRVMKRSQRDHCSDV